MSGTQTANITPEAQGFHVANGQIIGPNGQAFIARGINIYDAQLSSVVSNAAAQPLTTDFSGINMIRLNAVGDPGSSYPSAASLAPQIAELTAKGIVVEIEDHTGISDPPYTGPQLAAEQSWYSSLASTFKSNPYVWFGTYNEPGNGTDLAGIAAQEEAAYNTIRATGNTNPILMEEPSGGNPGLVGTNTAGYDGAGPMTPSDYASMTNIVWDLHYYGWVSNYSTSLATVSAGLIGSAAGASGIAGAQTITSADGKVPVIIGEFGNSTTGGSIDPNGDQVIQAVGNSGSGFLAWGWDPDEQGDQLITDSGQITAYGRQIAAIIGSAPPTSTSASTAASNPPPTPETTGAAITVYPAGEPAVIISAGNLTTTSTGGDTFVLTAPGVIQATLGATAGHILFAETSQINLTEGSGNTVVRAQAGTNTWTAGAGTLSVIAGSGQDSFIYHAGNGRLTIDDFVTAQGDTLSIDSGLKASMKAASDGSGGTLLTFASGGGVDLKGITANPTSLIHWT